MPGLSSADHSVSPPIVDIPRDYNAAHDLIKRNLQAGRGAKLAYMDDYGQYSYGALAERVNRCANALVDLGLQPEQRILLCLQDTFDFPTAFLGAITAGIVPVPINTLLTSTDYQYILHDSRAWRSDRIGASYCRCTEPLLKALPRLKHVIVSHGDGNGHLSVETLLAHSR